MQFGPPRLRTSVCLSTHAVSEILASCLALSKQAVSACMAAEAPQPKYKLMFGSTATSTSYAIASPTPLASTVTLSIFFFSPHHATHSNPLPIFEFFYTKGNDYLNAPADRTQLDAHQIHALSVSAAR